MPEVNDVPESLLLGVLGGSLLPAAVVDKGRLVWVNQAFADLLGGACRELRGLDLEAVVALQGVAAWLAWAGGQGSTQRECRVDCPDGSKRVVAITATPLPGGDARVLLMGFDLTGERAAAQQLRYTATHDPLTGLPNRLLLEDHLRLALARLRRRRGSGCVGVLFVDVDHFKRVNDAYGHAAGDELLASVAQRL